MDFTANDEYIDINMLRPEILYRSSSSNQIKNQNESLLAANCRKNVLIPNHEIKKPQNFEHIFVKEEPIELTCDFTENNLTQQDKEHLTQPEAIDINSNNSEKKTETEKSTHTPHKLYECDVCLKSYATTTLLRRHRQTHTGNKPYACDQCPKSFTYKHSLNVHKKIHMGIKEYECETCKKPFTQKTNLLKHIMTHTGEKPFVCEICKKAFSQKITLIQHSQQHTGLKPYVCHVCDRAFTQRSNLEQHKVLHTGIKHYSCNLCEKKYNHKQGLNLHMLIHIGTKSHICQFCNKAFYLKSHLTDHLTCHTGERNFSCDICHMKFVRKQHLIQHKVVHTKIKPYTCEFCEKSFGQKNNLIKHKLIHFTEKSYVCEICHKKFVQKKSFDKHKCFQIEKQNNENITNLSEVCIIKPEISPVHTTEKLLSCQFCHKEFNKKEIFDGHKCLQIEEQNYEDIKILNEVCNIKSEVTPTHTTEKSFSCQMCHREFNEKEVFDRHECLHTTKKEYENEENFSEDLIKTEKLVI